MVLSKLFVWWHIDFLDPEVYILIDPINVLWSKCFPVLHILFPSLFPLNDSSWNKNQPFHTHSFLLVLNNLGSSWIWMLSRCDRSPSGAWFSLPDTCIISDMQWRSSLFKVVIVFLWFRRRCWASVKTPKSSRSPPRQRISTRHASS